MLISGIEYSDQVFNALILSRDSVLYLFKERNPLLWMRCVIFSGNDYNGYDGPNSSIISQFFG